MVHGIVANQGTSIERKRIMVCIVWAKENATTQTSHVLLKTMRRIL